MPLFRTNEIGSGLNFSKSICDYTSLDMKQIKRSEHVKLRELVPNTRGLEKAIASVLNKVKLMVSASDFHSISNAKCKTEEAFQKFEQLIDLGEKRHEDIVIVMEEWGMRSV